MKANKYIFDLYSTCEIPFLTKEEYKEYYDKHNIVYIALLDEGVYTKVSREEMFTHNMHQGCFIQHIPNAREEDVSREAITFANKHSLLFAFPSEFRQIESRKEDLRAMKAFATAEELLHRG